MLLDMFGPSALLCGAATASDGDKVSFVTLSNFLQSYADYSGHAGKWQQALPRKKPVHSIARGCFHTAGRVWGVSSGSVTLFVSCKATEWPRLQGGYISGRLRPTHLVAQVDDSKTMGYVLAGRLLFWSRCIWYEGCRRNIWCILRRGGHSTSSAWSVSVCGFCHGTCNVSWCQLITCHPSRRLLVNAQTICRDNESMTLNDIGSQFLMVPK